MLPSAADAAACGVGLRVFVDPISTDAISPGASLPNRSRWQRDRTVGNNSSGRDVTSTNIDADGGSSSVFNSAFCASDNIASASSTMITRRRPSNGR